MATVKEASAKNPEVKHPLVVSTPRILTNFEDWFARWEQAACRAEKMGLLHALTADPEWWEDEGLVFTLLDIADGFDSVSNFIDDSTSGWNTYNEKSAESRQMVAKKAFSVLCTRFFNKFHWFWLLNHEVLFQKVLWFLRKATRSRETLRNRGEGKGEAETHYYNIYQNFLFEFAKLGWTRHGPSGMSGWDEDTRKAACERLKNARPQLLDVLSSLGKLFWLESNDAELDDVTIKLLIKKALSDELWLPRLDMGHHDRSHRKAVTLEEALYGGSAAAYIVVINRIKVKEQKRIDVLVERNRKRKEAARKAQELQDIQQKKRALDEQARNLQPSATK